MFCVSLRYCRPDPNLEREFDIRVRLQMASVVYVHTQRFQAEVVAFMQHFTQLQDVLGRQRAAMEGQAVSVIMFALIFCTIRWKGVREIVQHYKVTGFILSS